MSIVGRRLTLTEREDNWPLAYPIQKNWQGIDLHLVNKGDEFTICPLGPQNHHRTKVVVLAVHQGTESIMVQEVSGDAALELTWDEWSWMRPLRKGEETIQPPRFGWVSHWREDHERKTKR